MAVALTLGCGAAATQRSAPPEAFVYYERTGGLAGVDVRLSINNEGEATLASGRLSPRSGTLPGQTMQQLRRALARADLSELKGSYTPGRPVPDGFSYAICHAGRTVEASDFAVAPQLQPVIDALERSIDHLRGHDRRP